MIMAYVMVVVIKKEKEKFRKRGGHGKTKYVTFTPKERVRLENNLEEQLRTFSEHDILSQASEVELSTTSPEAFDSFLSSVDEVNASLIEGFCIRSKSTR